MKVQTPEFDLRVGLDQINGTHHPQEDSYDCGETPYGYYYVLADGMGGYGGGDVSSQAVVAAFSECMKKGDSPETALSRANEALAKVKKRKNLPPEAGCTLVAVTVDITKDGVFCSFLSVGDSYIYYFPADGPMQQVNPLHENEDGSLYSALQGGEIEEVYTVVNALELYPGDRLMLASDGIQAFGENKLRSLFRKYPVPPMQHHHEDVIPGEAGDMVYRILHQLEEETELGLQNDPEYYQDNTSVMIVEWPPAAQKSQGKAIAVKSKSRIILSRDRMLMAGVIVVLALALCFALFLNSGEVSKIVQNSAPVSQTAPQPQPANLQQEGTVVSDEKVKKFENALTESPDDYVSIVVAWAKLANTQKRAKLEDLKTWFYGKDDATNPDKFDSLMKRCNGLLAVCGANVLSVKEEAKKQVDGMLAALMETDSGTIENLLSTKDVSDNVLKFGSIKVDVPHFRLLDLVLASKVSGTIISDGKWLNWFIYEFDTSKDRNLEDKKKKWQNEVWQKALGVTPDNLLNAYKKEKSASTSNVEALLKNNDFVVKYSDGKEEWITAHYQNDDAQAFCEHLLRCLITKNEDKGEALRRLGLTVADLKKLQQNKGKFATAIKNLALAELEAMLDALTNKVSPDALNAVEIAYDVAKENGVQDCDVKVHEKVAKLTKREDFKNEIYKGDRYLQKPIWTNLLIKAINGGDANKLKDMGLNVDKICQLQRKQRDNNALKAALKAALMEEVGAADYNRFKRLYDIANGAENGNNASSFVDDLVWQFFTTNDKLNAAKVTEYAKDGKNNTGLMKVLVDQLIEKKDSTEVTSIDVNDLIDYTTVNHDNYQTSWANGPDSWRVYKYLLFCISDEKFSAIQKEAKGKIEDNRKVAREELKKDPSICNSSEYNSFVEKIKY